MEVAKWRKVLDRYLVENTMHADEYAEMDNLQKQIIQEIKKSFKRLKEKYDKELLNF
jgi:hypothetical protein